MIIQDIHKDQIVHESWLRELANSIFYVQDKGLQQHNMHALQDHCAEIGRLDIYMEFNELLQKDKRMKYIQENRILSHPVVEFEPIEDFGVNKENALPKFNPDWLPVTYKRFALELAESIGVSLDMVGMAIITAFSATLSHKVIINPKPDFFENPNLYTVIIAEPSERKSPILKEIEKPFYDYQSQENERLMSIIQEQKQQKRIQDRRIKKIESDIVNGSGDAVELNQELENMKPVAVDHFIQLVANDITVERIVDLLDAQHERIALFSAEGNLFKIISGLYSNEPNAGVLLQGYSGEYFDLQRKNGSDIHLKHPLITILTMVQPIVIEKLFSEGELSRNGMTARFAYIKPESLIGKRKFYTDQVSERARDGYIKGVTEWLNIPTNEKPDIVTLGDSARKLAADFYELLEEIQARSEGSKQQWLGKAFGLCMRVALVLHCMKHGTTATLSPVDESTMNAAIDIGSYIAGHTMHVLESVGTTMTEGERTALYIKKKIENIYLTGTESDQEFIPGQELWQKCRSSKYDTKDKLKKGLEELERRQFLKINKVQGDTGRPKDIVLLNPEWVKKFNPSPNS